MRILIIRHIEKKGTNGGDVYSKSIEELLKMSFPGSRIDIVFGIINDSQMKKRLRALKSLLRSLFSTDSAKILYFKTGRCLTEIKSLLRKNDYQLLVIDHVEMLWILPHISAAGICLCVSQNVESKLYEAFLQKKKIPSIFRKFFTRDQKAFARFEFENINQVGRLVSISEADAEYYRQYCPNTRIIVVPPLFTYRPYRYESRVVGKIRIGMLANFHWWPNQEGMVWFLRKVVPHITVPYEIHCFGIESERYDCYPFCRGHGFVENIHDIWSKCDVMIAPINDGGGVNMKLAESLFNRMPVICTSFAGKGLSEALAKGAACFISDDGRAWAEHINRIVERRLPLVSQKEALAEYFDPANHISSIKKLLN